MASCGRSMLLSIASILIVFPMTNAELVTKPTDAEAVVDAQTYFNCSTSVVLQEIQWFHIRVGSNGADRNFVYGYNEFYAEYRDRFGMEKNDATGTYNLIIRSVKVQDAGRYECQDDAGRGAKASAQLIVLDQIPVCQSNQKTNEVIGPNDCNIPLGELQLTCSATYHGDDSPVLKWFRNGSDKALVDGVSSSVSGNRFLSNLTLNADSIKNGSSFQCQTTRSKPTPHGCTSGSLKVIGASAVAAATCPSRQPLIDAILVICLFLIPIIIVASLLGGIFIQTRRPLNIFSRQDTRKFEPAEPLILQASATSAEDVPLNFDEVNEPEKIPELNPQAMENQSEQCNQLNMTIKELTMKLTKEKNKNSELEKNYKQLENKYKQLGDEKRELEWRLYPTAMASYDANPKLVRTIEINDPKAGSKKKKKPIFGMTILKHKLFVVTEKSSEITVYDSVTFNPEAALHLDEMSNPLDITSCNTKESLYICDGDHDSEKFILRVDSNKTVSKKWSIGPDEGRLSVTWETNVVVSLFNGNKINEYSSDGDLIRTIRLSPADNINHPLHAIKTTSMHFIFSHGFGDDPLQRICVADVEGKIRKSFGGKKGTDWKEQQMNRPVHLLEDGSRNILVADMKNNRILLLSPTLECKRILVGDLRFPMRLCLDEEKEILFVAENNYKKGACTYDNGRILIYNCKTKQSN